MTAERTSAYEQSENPVFQRHIVAYEYAKKRIRGNVLEVGCGEGYGIAYLYSLCDRITAIDKSSDVLRRLQKEAKYPNVVYKKMNVPLLGFADHTFDCVVSFQVIEHVKEDTLLIGEIARVLKPKGVFIVSTPNHNMSLTRNPWHVREYTVETLQELLSPHFDTEAKGIYGKDIVTQYYAMNKESVAQFKKFDILDLEHRLPRRVLQIPYDILNRINRKKIRSHNEGLVDRITYEDFYVAEANEMCFDLFFIGTKKDIDVKKSTS